MPNKIDEYATGSGRSYGEGDRTVNMVDVANPSSVKGAGTVAATVTAAPLSATALSCAMVKLQSDPANTTNVLWGGDTTQPMVLLPGLSTDWIPIADAALISVKMASGTGNVNWIAL
ncbi:MAG: hypothetical protein M0R22_12190 [Dehalococcoidia bacterium]|jgi:hypothetical protein|nr:hypothetical protein [Dehalococcoidia bacterium]